MFTQRPTINKNCYTQAAWAWLTSRWFNHSCSKNLVALSQPRQHHRRIPPVAGGPVRQSMQVTSRFFPWSWEFSCCGMKGRHCEFYYYFQTKMFCVICVMTSSLEWGGVVTKFREDFPGQRRPPDSYGRTLFLEQQIPYLTNSWGPRDSHPMFHGLNFGSWDVNMKPENTRPMFHRGKYNTDAPSCVNTCIWYLLRKILGTC